MKAAPAPPKRAAPLSGRLPDDLHDAVAKMVDGVTVPSMWRAVIILVNEAVKARGRRRDG